jgi:hypothetical protein
VSIGSRGLSSGRSGQILEPSGQASSPETRALCKKHYRCPEMPEETGKMIIEIIILFDRPVTKTAMSLLAKHLPDVFKKQILKKLPAASSSTDLSGFRVPVQRIHFCQVFSLSTFYS